MERARLDVDELEALSREARVKFAASPLPACFALKIGGLARAVPMKGWAVMRKGEDGIRAVLMGLSMMDAVARQARLNLPHRPDGFHYWN